MWKTITGQQLADVGVSIALIGLSVGLVLFRFKTLLIT